MFVPYSSSSFSSIVLNSLATRLQYQLEETIDDLDDIGFDEQVLSGVLRTAHLEISGFIARCDQAMLTTEQRILRILVR